MTLSLNAIIDSGAFVQALATDKPALSLFRGALQQSRKALQQRHQQGARAEKVVQVHAQLIDFLLQQAWNWHCRELSVQPDAAFVAVGGYGRGELHPYSDIDLLLLLPKDEPGLAQFLERLIQFLWDIGLEVGHSVRTIKECVAEAKADITVATNLMETRLLLGNADLFQKMLHQTAAPKLWPSKKFFRAKLEEQRKRHHQFHDTAYKLEPNVKEGPGGLRDTHMIMWVAQRHFHITSLSELVKLKLLSQEEYDSLIQHRNFLWSIRIRLHYLAGRHEDRLLFDYQRTLATELAYHDKPHSLAVEQFMKRYYLTIKELSLLNEILLQSFDELIFARGKAKTKTLTKSFRSHGGYIEVSGNKVFENNPSAMLEMFLLLQKNPQLKGVRARTIRLLRASLPRIDAEFRKQPVNHKLFMEIMGQVRGITHELRRMNAYGVLGAYIPIFGKIVGQMQHDLFHVYTVDEHSLFVLRNLRRFTVAEYRREFPKASSMMKTLHKPERLYLAALFHDIAKGRGGDHSVLGEHDAYKFCKQHGMSEYDARFVGFLVRQHLLMSWTAQRKDITDPDIITGFATQVGDQERLDNLYLLTVADMRGTSPKVWNDWRGHLLMQLYAATTRVFTEGHDALLADDKHVTELQKGALEITKANPELRTLIERYWEQMDSYYFLRYDADSLAWHAQTVSECSAANFPLVATRFNPESGGSELLIYTPDREGLFVDITGALDNLGLSIVDARINTSQYGFAMDTFVVLDQKGVAVKDNKSLSQMQQALRQLLIHPRSGHNMKNSHVSRQMRHFPIKCQVNFSTASNQKLTIMEVTAQDRLGLLHQVALSLAECKVALVAAKVFTYGERAEDVFFITDRERNPIADVKQLECLQQQVEQRLSHDQAQDNNTRAITF